MNERQERENASVRIWHAIAAWTNTPRYDANDNVIADHSTARVSNASTLPNRIINAECTVENHHRRFGRHTISAITKSHAFRVLELQKIWKVSWIRRWFA